MIGSVSFVFMHNLHPPIPSHIAELPNTADNALPTPVSHAQ